MSESGQSIPQAFFPRSSTFDGFARSKIRVPSQANTSFGPFDTTIIELPEGVIDMDTFSIGGLLTTSNGTASTYSMCTSIEELVDAVYVDIGGISFTPGNNFVNQTWNTMATYTGTYNKRPWRQLMNLEFVPTGSSSTPSAATVVTQSAQQSKTPFQLSNFVGFLNSIRILYTDLMPPVRISIRWASAAVLASSAGGTPSYIINNLYATVDRLTIAPAVHQIVQDRLAQGPLEIPFMNFTNVIGSVAQLTNSTRFSTTANCLEAVWGTFLSPTYNNISTAAYDINTWKSTYFTKGDSSWYTTTPGASTSQFSINGVSYPQVPMDLFRLEPMMHTLQSMKENKDLTTAVHPNFNTLQTYAENFFLHANSFTFNDPDSSSRKCGLSGAGNQLLGAWNVISTGTNNVLPFITLIHKSSLILASGRAVSYKH